MDVSGKNGRIAGLETGQFPVCMRLWKKAFSRRFPYAGEHNPDAGSWSAIVVVVLNSTGWIRRCCAVFQDWRCQLERTVRIHLHGLLFLIRTLDIHADSLDVYPLPIAKCDFFGGSGIVQIEKSGRVICPNFCPCHAGCQKECPCQNSRFYFPYWQNKFFIHNVSWCSKQILWGGLAGQSTARKGYVVAKGAVKAEIVSWKMR